MATCFRVVSNKLRSTYLKNCSYLLVEYNAVNLRKQAQHMSARAKSNATTGNRFTAPTQFCSSDNTYRLPSNILPNSSISSLNASALYRCGNGLNTEPSALRSYEKHFMSSSVANKKDNVSNASEGRPTDEQLEVVLNALTNYLEKLFSRPVPAPFFHKNIILENNIRKTRHVGINKYMYQVALLRMIAHVKYAYVKLHILKITKHPEDGTIKCRWRICGISGSTIIFQFWKFAPSTFGDEIKNAPTWHDGFSIYHVGSDGLIHKHIIDKMMPDDDRIGVDKSSIAPKVTLCLGLSSENLTNAT